MKSSTKSTELIPQKNTSADYPAFPQDSAHSASGDDVAATNRRRVNRKNPPRLWFGPLPGEVEIKFDLRKSKDWPGSSLDFASDGTVTIRIPPCKGAKLIHMAVGGIGFFHGKKKVFETLP